MVENNKVVTADQEEMDAQDRGLADQMHLDEQDNSLKDDDRNISSVNDQISDSATVEQLDSETLF